MKKIISVLLIALLMLSISVSVSAEETKFDVKITSSASQVEPGGEFEVTFLVTNITEASGLVGLEMVIEYDASKVNVVNKTNVFPTQWGKDAADFSPKYDTDTNKKQVGKWTQVLLYDGDKAGSEIAVFKDNELGVKVTFKALEGVSGNAKIGLASELSAATDNLETVYGKSSAINVKIGVKETTKTEVKTTATEPVTTLSTPDTTTVASATQSVTSTASQVTTGTTSVSDVTGSEIATSSSAIASSDTTSVSQSASASVTQSESETTASASDVATTTASVSSGDNNDGNNSTMIVIAVIAGLAIAVVAFLGIKKFKKATNDDNPVNPG